MSASWTHAMYAICFIVLFVCVALWSLYPRSAFSQGTGVAISGYAWSDTIGWIDLNCSNTNVCATNPFGLFVATNGSVSGYAWSDSIGWISANASDLTGCPSGSCSATLSSTVLTGWLKALSGSDAQNGGWDGFISLNGSGYGIAYSNGNFGACSNGISCAWGDINVGWIDFSLAHTTFNTCSASASYTCADTQTVVQTSIDTSCQQTITNTSCTAPQFCSTGSPVCLWPQPTFVASGSNSGDLQARPSVVPKNSSTTVAWNIANVSDCTVTGTNGDAWTGVNSAATSCSRNASGACISGTISEQTIYTLTCTGLDSSVFTRTATVNIIPGYEEVCNPGDVHVDGKCVHQ